MSSLSPALPSWIAAIVLTLLATVLPAAEQPNILWVTSEDNGPHLGCYGDDYATRSARSTCVRPRTCRRAC